ncbi:MAG: hypothetical protein V1882_02740 [Candidatus Omnitrophota bacterium]
MQVITDLDIVATAKTGDVVSNDQIKWAWFFLRRLNHGLELAPVLGKSTGDRVIGIPVGHFESFPFREGKDLALLVIEGLFLFVRGTSEVSDRFLHDDGPPFRQGSKAPARRFDRETNNTPAVKRTEVPSFFCFAIQCRTSHCARIASELLRAYPGSSSGISKSSMVRSLDLSALSRSL